MPDFDPLGALRVLSDHGVRFVLIGAVAARLQGAPLVTADLDIVPDRAPENMERLEAALSALGARLRVSGAPKGIEAPLDAALLATLEIWTLTTRAGDLDLVFRPAGLDAAALLDGAPMIEIAPGLVVAVADLADVVRSKEAAGRDKDLGQLPLLRATLAERDRRAGAE